MTHSILNAVLDKLCLKGVDALCFSLILKGERLCNTSMETYQASYRKPDDENIGNDSENCKESYSGKCAGCMNCYLDAGNDASFLWADGIEEQVRLQPCMGRKCPVIPGNPGITVSIDGLNITVNWASVNAASGYKFFLIQGLRVVLLWMWEILIIFQLYSAMVLHIM